MKIEMLAEHCFLLRILTLRTEYIKIRKERYTYNVHENCLIFKTTHPPCPSTSNIFLSRSSATSNFKRHPLRPKPSPANNNCTVHVNERNQNKSNSCHIQIDHAFHYSI